MHKIVFFSVVSLILLPTPVQFCSIALSVCIFYFLEFFTVTVTHYFTAQRNKCIHKEQKCYLKMYNDYENHKYEWWVHNDSLSMIVLQMIICFSKLLRFSNLEIILCNEFLYRKGMVLPIIS